MLDHLPDEFSLIHIQFSSFCQHCANEIFPRGMFAPPPCILDPHGKHTDVQDLHIVTCEETACSGEYCHQ